MPNDTSHRDDTTRSPGALRAERFRAAVAEAGYDLAALAAACGVRLSTARAWSRGQYPIPDTRLSALAALVGAPVARQLAEITGWSYCHPVIDTTQASPPARGPGRGRLPTPGSPAHRRAVRIVRALGPIPKEV